MRSIAAILASSLLLAGASCEQPRQAPPVPVEVKVVVPVPCQEEVPQCRSPAYDTAKKEQAGDAKVKLLRAEAITQAACLEAFRRALERCRATLPPP